MLACFAYISSNSDPVKTVLQLSLNEGFEFPHLFAELGIAVSVFLKHGAAVEKLGEKRIVEVMAYLPQIRKGTIILGPKDLPGLDPAPIVTITSVNQTMLLHTYNK